MLGLKTPPNSGIIPKHNVKEDRVAAEIRHDLNPATATPPHPWRGGVLKKRVVLTFAP